MNRIAFFERYYKNEEGNINRKNFQKQIETAGIPLFHDWDELKGNLDFDILFYHGNDSSKLYDQDPRGNDASTLKKELTDKLLIRFGGHTTCVPPSTSKRLEYINVNDLDNRFDVVCKGLNNLEKDTQGELDVKKIVSIVWGIDPKLEATIHLWKSLNLFALKKKKITEDKYEAELKQIKENVNTDILDIDFDSFNGDSDMDKLYKKLFLQN